MSHVAQLDLLLAGVPPHVATATVLIATATLVLLIGMVRGRLAFLWHLPAVIFVMAGAAAYWSWLLLRLGIRGNPRSIVVMIAAGAFVVHWLLQLRQRPEPRAADFGSLRAARCYLVVALCATGVLLFYKLGGLEASLMTWEAPVVGGFPEVGGFAAAFQSRQSILHYTLRRVLWDDGILSAGDTSLFYGVPTYALFHVAGFSPWTLRCLAAVATLLSIGVIFTLARRFFGPVVAAAAALCLGLNHCVLFYGRYGSSPAGTMLAVLLAVLCTWLFLDRDRSSWWMGAICAVALYVATLQYSPARIVVLILLGLVVVVLVCQWRRFWWQRAVGLTLIVAAAIGVWQVQTAHHTQGLFLFARGEQYFDFVVHPHYIRELFGHDLLGKDAGAAPLTLADKIELLYRVIEYNLPRYAALIGPGVQTGLLSDGGEGVLPTLYYGPLSLFILLGMGHSLWRWRSWPHACLLLWLVGTTVPLLLTNRVDSHRAMLLVLPLMLWAALGLWEAARVMTDAKVPRLLQHCCAGALALTVVYNDVTRLYYKAPIPPVGGSTIAEEVAQVKGPVAVGALIDHGELAWAQLTMLDRELRDPRWSGTLIAENLLHAIEGNAGTPAEVLARELQRTIKSTTVILAPADRFRTVVTAMQNRGPVRVTERGTQRFHVLRLDGGAEVTGVTDDELRPLPTVAVPPTPTPMPLAGGPQIGLTTLTPRDVAFGFEPPEVNRSWTKSPITMGGVRYDLGLGMHAWCRMTYDVPLHATAFQAIIGLSDEIRSCAAAAVTFEVRDDKDAVLFDSGLVDGETPPRPIHVELGGTASITLIATEGGNGRDCDHANWAVPVFLITGK